MHWGNPCLSLGCTGFFDTLDNMMPIQSLQKSQKLCFLKCIVFNSPFHAWPMANQLLVWIVIVRQQAIKHNFQNRHCLIITWFLKKWRIWNSYKSPPIWLRTFQPVFFFEIKPSDPIILKHFFQCYYFQLIWERVNSLYWNDTYSNMTVSIDLNFKNVDIIISFYHFYTHFRYLPIYSILILSTKWRITPLTSVEDTSF